MQLIPVANTFHIGMLVKISIFSVDLWLVWMKRAFFLELLLFVITFLPCTFD